MKIQFWAQQAGTYIAKFAQLQLFITLFSLPILICWGLPLSLLSPLGNLIFGPALTLFLFLSSLIFFTELFYVPNGWFIQALEITTQWWLRIMHADTHTWLIGFAKPDLSILLFFTFGAVAIMLCRATNSLWRSIGCLSALMVGLCIYVSWGSGAHSLHAPVQCNKGEVAVMAINGTIVVVDPGFMGQKISAASWAQYTLIPHIIKSTGKNCIDHLIVLQPGGMLFEAIEKLCTKIRVTNLYMPYWNGKMKASALRRYGAFKKAAQLYGTTIHRLSNKICTVSLPGSSLTIEPVGRELKKQDISYLAYAAHTRIDNQDITLYSATYTKKNPVHMRKQLNNADARVADVY